MAMQFGYHILTMATRISHKSLLILLSLASASLSWAVEKPGDLLNEFLEKFVTYNQKHLKLAETRADLESRLFKFAQQGTKIGDDIVLEIQGITTTKTQQKRIARFAQEVTDRQDAIESANKLLVRKGPLPNGLPPLISQFLASKEARSAIINAKSCLATLDRMNESNKAIGLAPETTARLSDVRNRLASDSATTSSAPISVLTLLDSTFDCDRTLLEAKFDAWIQPSKVAQCFSVIALKQQEATGPIVLDGSRSLKILADPQSFISPGVETLKKYESGKEAELVTYIMQQPTASVTPADVFRQSLALAKGDLYVALRMAFSVLRANRTNLELQRKLIDLRGDRAGGGRNGGDWYHFFGAMLVRQVYWNWVVKFGLTTDNPSTDAKKKYTNSAGVATWEILVKGIKENRPTLDEKELCRLDQQLGPRDPSITIDPLPAFLTPVRNRSTSK
jgi:hypothetical protein